MSKIQELRARQILDSRGFPTVEVDVVLDCGVVGRASVPSGASTGTYEAVERRDGDSENFRGKGVLCAVESISGEIQGALKGKDVCQQMQIDQLLCDLDGTDNKERLGANALLAVSLASARAAATYEDLPFYRYLGGSFCHTLPVPLINVLNGGVHADNGIDIQEFMIAPVGADTFAGALQMGSEIFMSLKDALRKQGLSTNVGDEGGFAPQLENTESALDFLMEAIEAAGYRPGEDVGIALDVAANELSKKNGYAINGYGKGLSSQDMVSFYEKCVAKYPIVSIEDPLAEEDWDGWCHMTERLGDQIQIVGDDLFVTNIERLQRGVDVGAANAILIKPNQIGTLTETILTIEKAERMGYAAVISHRSGETEDTTIADIAVATNASQIKTGSMCRTDRLAKYNQLLRIEEGLQAVSDFPGAHAFPRSYYA